MINNKCQIQKQRLLKTRSLTVCSINSLHNHDDFESSTNVKHLILTSYVLTMKNVNFERFLQPPKP